jgi:hypothetical protein
MCQDALQVADHEHACRAIEENGLTKTLLKCWPTMESHIDTPQGGDLENNESNRQELWRFSESFPGVTWHFKHHEDCGWSPK